MEYRLTLVDLILRCLKLLSQISHSILPLDRSILNPQMFLVLDISYVFLELRSPLLLVLSISLAYS